MDQTTVLVGLLAVAFAGLFVVLVSLRRDRRRAQAAHDDRFAAATEGETRCPRCGMGNLWTDRTCIACGTRLPG